jgi:hypothetical protein
VGALTPSAFAMTLIPPTNSMAISMGNFSCVFSMHELLGVAYILSIGIAYLLIHDDY